MIVNHTINKVINNTDSESEALLDLTADTVAPENLLLNKTAHNSEGEGIVGEMPEGGTSNYDELENRPQINSNLLTGNKTGSQLGLQNKNLDSPISIGGQIIGNVEGALSALNESKSDLVNGKVPVNELPVYTPVIGSIQSIGGIVPPSSSGDEDKYLRSDGTWAKPAGGGGGVSDYDDLTNRPKVNGTTLSGDKTGTQLGLQNVVLSSAMTIGGQTITEVEPALRALNENSSAGHTILDEDGTTYPQRSKLQFEGCEVTDDAVNGVTVVKCEGGGSSIIISTNETTLHGKTVTITGASKTKTATIGNDGKAVIDGFMDTGTVTISASDGIETASATISIPYFGNYAVSLSFWSATLSITTDSPDLYGQTVTVKDSNNQTVATSVFSGQGTATATVNSTGTYTVSATVDGVTVTESVTVSAQTTYNVSLHLWTATVSISTSSSDLYGATITVKKGGSTIGTTTFSAQGTATYNAHETGTYTFECTYSGQTYSDSVTVSAETSYSATIDTTPDGATVTPTDDIQTWLKCAMITDKSYTTLSEVLNDATTLSALMLSNNAVDYLVRSTSWVSDITGNQTAMTDIGASDYCANKLLANSTWRQAICDSAYFESVLNVKVPTMTSNTTPSGEVTWYPHYSSYPGYQAFNGNESAYQQAAHLGNKTTSGGEWLTYHFDSTGMIIKKYYIHICDGNKGRSCKYKIQGSNDGINWTDLYTDNDAVIGQAESFISGYGYYKNSFIINNNDNYTYYRLYMLESANLYGSDYSTEVLGLQFYGRASS